MVKSCIGLTDIDLLIDPLIRGWLHLHWNWNCTCQCWWNDYDYDCNSITHISCACFDNGTYITYGFHLFQPPADWGFHGLTWFPIKKSSSKSWVRELPRNLGKETQLRELLGSSSTFEDFGKHSRGVPWPQAEGESAVAVLVPSFFLAVGVEMISTRIYWAQEFATFLSAIHP